MLIYFLSPDTLKVDSDDEERALALLYGGEDSEEEESEGDEGDSEDGTGFKGLNPDAMDPMELALERALDRFEGEERGKRKRKGKEKKEKEFDAKTAKYSDWFAPLKHEYAPHPDSHPKPHPQPHSHHLPFAPSFAPVTLAQHPSSHLRPSLLLSLAHSVSKLHFSPLPVYSTSGVILPFL